MSKMSDMAMTIEELRNTAAAINEAANWLAAQFSSEADATPVAEAKTKKKTAGALAKAQAAKVSAVQNVFLSVSRTNWFRFSNS